MALIIYIFIVFFRKILNPPLSILFSFGLAGASFANFFNFNYDVYNRSWSIGSVFILFLLLIILSKINFKNVSFPIKISLVLIIIFLFPYLLNLLSEFIWNTSIYVLIMPIIFFIDFDMGMSIRDAIGFLI